MELSDELNGFITDIIRMNKLSVISHIDHVWLFIFTIDSNAVSNDVRATIILRFDPLNCDSVAASLFNDLYGVNSIRRTIRTIVDSFIVPIFRTAFAIAGLDSEFVV